MAVKQRAIVFGGRRGDRLANPGPHKVQFAATIDGFLRFSQHKRSVGQKSLKHVTTRV